MASVYYSAESDEENVLDELLQPENEETDEEEESNYHEWTLQRLKEELGRRNLSKTGRKQELIDRLVEHDESGAVLWSDEELEVEDLPPFRKHPGPTFVVGDEQNAGDIFNRFFTPDLIEVLVTETNRYARGKEAVNWVDTSAEEIRAFLGVTIWMGLKQVPDLYDYWSNSTVLSVDGIKHVFPRKRYEELLHNLHCADNGSAIPAGQPGHDKIHKIRNVLNILNRNFQDNWTPHQQNSVDEGMIPFKGRIGFKQYMKDKPTKWSIKVWKLVDSVRAYLLHFKIYTGKTDNPGANLGEKVVLDLCTSLPRGIPWKLYFDNFYTSLSLASSLLEQGIFCTGTTRPNRVGFPHQLHMARLKTGESKWMMKEPRFFALKWKDTKDVYVLSTMAKPGVEDVRRKEKGHVEGVIKQCPSVVVDYRKYMGGVDTNDQHLSYYKCSRKSSKWWMPVFMQMLDMAIVNAWICECFLRGDHNSRKQKVFRDELVVSLCGKFTGRKKVGRPSGLPGPRFDKAEHWPKKREQRLLCLWLWKPWPYLLWKVQCSSDY